MSWLQSLLSLATKASLPLIVESNAPGVMGMASFRVSPARNTSPPLPMAAPEQTSP